MIFSGFQKLTLLDFPGTVACTLFTKGCNLRCPFCHNASLVTSTPLPEYPEEEILSFLKKRQGILEGVCITGGEPLLHPSLPDFIKKVKTLGFKVKLDTNGTFPERLSSLISENLLDYVAMDIKNSFEKYPLTTGCESINLSDIKKSIDLLMEGSIPYEFRTTVCAELHTTEDILSIARRIRGSEKYFLQNFKDSGNILTQGLSPVAPTLLEEITKKAQNIVPNTSFR